MSLIFTKVRIFKIDWKSNQTEDKIELKVKMNYKEFQVDPLLFLISFIVAAGMAIYQSYYNTDSSSKKTLKPNKKNKSFAFEKLAEHTKEFDKAEIISLLDGKIHVAIGKNMKERHN